MRVGSAARASSRATQRSRSRKRVKTPGQPAESQEVHRALERREPRHRRVSGIELPGVDREDGRLAPLAHGLLGGGEAALRKHAKRPGAAERQPPAEDRARQRRDLDQRPAVAPDPVRPGQVRPQRPGAAPASSRRRSGTPRPRGRAEPPSPGGGSTTPPRDGRRRARPRPSSIASRARSRSSRNSSGVISSARR